MARADDDFEKQVRPLLVQHCLACHGPEKQKANLRLDAKSGWQTGGDSGPAIVTSRSSDKDKARGLEVGADAYIVKSGFDRNGLIEAVARLL